ncbi:hypothetical protein BJ912DRAFT_943645, partial [Pholiota molesta]
MLDLAGKHPAAFAHRHAAPHARPVPAVDVTLLHDALIVNLCSVAALTWLVYDLILCFSEEASRHSRRIYLIVRYASILNLGCNTWPYIVVITTSVTTLLPDVMLLIRINAVYGWCAPYLLLTGSLFFLQLITSLGIGFVYVSTSTPISLTGLPTPGCLTTAPTLPAAFTLAAWIPSVLALGAYLALVLRPFLSVTCSLDARGRLSWAALRA